MATKMLAICLLFVISTIGAMLLVSFVIISYKTRKEWASMHMSTL